MLKMQESILRADFVQKLLHIVAEMCSYWSRNCKPIILLENLLDTLGSKWLDTSLEHITLDHTELEADLAFPSKVCKVPLKWKIKFRKFFGKYFAKELLLTKRYNHASGFQSRRRPNVPRKSDAISVFVLLHILLICRHFEWLKNDLKNEFSERRDLILQFYLEECNCKISTLWFNLGWDLQVQKCWQCWISSRVCCQNHFDNLPEYLNKIILTFC